MPIPIDKKCFKCKEDLTQKEIDYRNSLIFTTYSQQNLCDECYYKQVWTDARHA